MGIPFFRKIDRQFCIIDSVPVNAAFIADRNGADTNSINALLCKAYIDVYMGLTYEVLAAVNYDDESSKFTVLYKYDDVSLKIRANDVESSVIIVDGDSLNDRFEAKEKLIEEHYQKDELIKSRDISSIDHHRNMCYPDEVLAMYIDDSGHVEFLWIKLSMYLGESDDGKHILGGRLYSEPFGNSGHRRNDMAIITVDVGEEGTCPFVEAIKAANL